MSTDRPAAGLGRSIASVVLNSQAFRGMLETDAGKFYIMDAAKLAPFPKASEPIADILDRFRGFPGSAP